MLLCLMELRTYRLLVNSWKLMIQKFQLLMGLKTLCPNFSKMLTKPQLWIRWLQLIWQYTNCLVLVYITNLILYSNQNNMNFTIGTLVYSMEMIRGWLLISLEYTDNCAWENNFSPHLFCWIQHYVTELKTLQSSIIYSGS